MPNFEEIKVRNEALIDSLITSGMEKKAESAVTAFTRMKVREDGIMDRVHEPTPISNAELTKSVHDDKPMRICEREPGSPAALTIGFGTTPSGYYIRGSRYEVHFGRYGTRMFIKDVDELRTYDMDIRQVISDNAIRDMSAEKDAKWFGSVERILSNNTDTAGVVLNYSGVAQWKALSGGISRNNLQDAISIMEAVPTGRFTPAKVVANNITARQFLKFGREEAGGDLSQEWLKNGWADSKFAGLEWIWSIKHDIIPDNRLYFFADPSAIGKHFELEAPTMHIENKAFILTWFVYACYGAAIASSNGLAIADFT